MATEIKSARDALEKIRCELNSYCNSCTLLDRMTEDPPDYTCLRDSLLEIERIVVAALDLPRRNCDVGTPDEQVRRFEQFCDSVDGFCDKCKLDPPGFCPTCGVRWSSQWTYQPPAEGREGGNDGSK